VKPAKAQTIGLGARMHSEAIRSYRRTERDDRGEGGREGGIHARSSLFYKVCGAQAQEREVRVLDVDGGVWHVPREAATNTRASNDGQWR